MGGFLMNCAVTRVIGSAAIAALIAGGPAEATPAHASTYDLMLTAGLGDGVALMLGPMVMPTPTLPYMENAGRIFLEPLGFTGSLVPVTTPFSFDPDSRMYDFDAVIRDDGVDALVAAVHAQIAAGTVSAEDPLVIFGYSQGTTIASEAMERLAAEGVPQDYLHFVLVGHAASAFGGILNSFLPSLPAWLVPLAESALKWFQLDELMGATTPSDLYQTDVYSFAGDGWANWPASAEDDPFAVQQALGGMLFSHLEYFGLDPEAIRDAVVAHTDDLTTYYTLAAPDNPLVAFWDAAMNIVFSPDQFEWLRF